MNWNSPQPPLAPAGNGLERPDGAHAIPGRLGGKVAIVTGGGTGIGRAIALLFGSEGATVVVAGRRAEPITSTANEIVANQRQAIAVTTDVTAAEEVARLTELTVEKFGKIDILVNNAGAVVSRTNALDCSESDWLQTMNANLHGTFLCSKSALPELIKVKGNIVHIASVFGLIGAARSAAYTAAKGALVGLTRSMAVDFGPQGVRVNAVCPAYVETDLNRSMLAALRAEGRFDTVLNRLPLGFIGEPNDVASAALFLASDEARWITGVALPVDGGMSAART